MSRIRGSVEERNEEAAANRLDADNDDNEASLLRLDPDTLDPSVHYRFVRDDPRRILQMMANRGYRTVTIEDGVRFKYSEMVNVQSDDGNIRFGGYILMCCPKEVHERRRVELERFSQQRLGAEKSRFEREAAQAGHKTITSGGPT